MKFIEIANLFESLQNKSKRLDKILILRDFYLNNKKDTPLVFDVMVGNFQRTINKKTIGISLKTIFDVISFVSKASVNDVEKRFNKIGDVGLLAVEFLSEGKQKSLFDNKLNFDDIISSFEEISKTKGTNSNKIKKERLSKLFLSAKEDVEYKFLARLLIDDLRIGVSIGVLKEACVNSFFPKLLGAHKYCYSCNFFNLNNDKCLKCSKKIDDNQEELISKRYKLVEVDTPKGEVGLGDFIGEYKDVDLIKFMLRIDSSKYVVKHEMPREIYKRFVDFFEKKYNLINSFSLILPEISSSLLSILNVEIILGTPILSMLGTRSNTVSDSFDISGMPALVDFKYDGLRVQIHNNCGFVKLFSRNLEDITTQFPEVVDFVVDNFSDCSFVLDSECVGFDFEKQEFLDFQILSRRILRKNVEEVSHISVVVKAFDIMYFNGKTLIDENYTKRREILETLFIDRELVQKVNIDFNKLKKMNKNFEY